MRHLTYRSLIFLMVYLYGCSSLNQEKPTIPPVNRATLFAATIENPITPTITLTASPIPTLSPQVAENAIKQMLNEETQCARPCLFGIIPEQTTLKEIQNFYEHKNMNFKRTYQEGRKDYYEAGFGFDESWGIILTNIVEAGIVRNLTLGLSFVNYTGSTPQQEWLAFRPNAVLERYGRPSNIELNLSFPVESGFPPGTAWYDIVMYFPDSDLIVKYAYELTNASPKITACPRTDKSLGMSMWLGKEPHSPPVGIVSLDKATTLSLEEFYDFLTTNSQTVCFDLNRKDFFSDP